MNITISAKPRFELPLTLADVSLLAKMAGMHYDATCRAATFEGGFLYGWRNKLQFELDNPDAVPSPVSAEWKHLDISLKILEIPIGLSTDEELLVTRLRADFLAALAMATKLLPSWTAVCDTEA